jgi:hypothetical protein
MNPAKVMAVTTTATTATTTIQLPYKMINASIAMNLPQCNGSHHTPSEGQGKA